MKPWNMDTTRSASQVFCTPPLQYTHLGANPPDIMSAFRKANYALRRGVRSKSRRRSNSSRVRAKARAGVRAKARVRARARAGGSVGAIAAARDAAGGEAKACAEQEQEISFKSDSR